MAKEAMPAVGEAVEPVAASKMVMMSDVAAPAMKKAVAAPSTLELAVLATPAAEIIKRRDGKLTFYLSTRALCGASAFSRIFHFRNSIFFLI